MRWVLTVVLLTSALYACSGTPDAAPGPEAVPTATPATPAAPAPPPPAPNPPPGAASMAHTARLEEGWVRAVPPNAGNTAVFFTWQNEGQVPAVLAGATSPAARRVELHTHIVEGGVAKMRKVDSFSVDAGATHRLEPGADHLMLLDLTGPIEAGANVDLVLSFADGSVKTWSVPARAEP